jgi:hypothetical protein
MKAIMHDINVIGVTIDIPLIAFIKALYPTYSHYLESLQANGEIKSLTFDTLVEKVAKNEKAFGKKSSHPTGETTCLSQKGKNQSHDSSKGEGNKISHGIKNFRGRGVVITEVRDLIFTTTVVERMGHMKQTHEESLRRRSNTSNIRKKTKVKQ